MKSGWFIALLPFLVLIVGCQMPPSSPPPGWRSPVFELLLDEADLPEDAQLDIEFPEKIKDPTVNHVTREWWLRRGSCGIIQSIWRAYTVADAERKYDELRASQFEPKAPLNPGEIFVPFVPPAEIGFRSQTADEFYLACGWWTVAYCEFIARYRNYVMELRLDREAEFEGHVSDGLTFAEIEAVLRAADVRFADVLGSFSTPNP